MTRPARFALEVFHGALDLAGLVAFVAFVILVFVAIFGA